MPIPIFTSADFTTVNNIIDGGGMGIVGLYRWRIDIQTEGIKEGDLVAVKKLGTVAQRPRIQNLKDEASILWGLHKECDFILRLFGVLSSEQEFSLVLEYMQYGSVSSFFRAILNPPSALESKDLWPLKIRIAKQVCQGMVFLHSKRILHRDLKAANVLLDERLNAKICDFGLAKIKQLTATVTSNPEWDRNNKNVNAAGTVSHIAPELLRGNGNPSPKSDVYSFGIFLWELMTDSEPYHGDCVVVILMNVIDGRLRPTDDRIPNHKPNELYDMMKHSYEQLPSDRPEFGELMLRFDDLDANILRRAREVVARDAIQEWEIQNNTPAKRIDIACRQGGTNTFTTSTNQDMRRPHSYSFNTQPLPAAVRSPVRCNETIMGSVENHEVSDIKSEEICASLDSSVADNTDNSEGTGVVNTNVIDCDPSDRLLGAPRQRIAVNWSVAHSDVTITEAKPSKIQYWAALFAVIMSMSCGIGGYFIRRCDTEGCCTQCFEGSDPGLKSNCSTSTYSGAKAVSGSQCTFSCGVGYVVNGNVTTSTCGSTGRWSGPFPYCRKIRQCPALLPPANGGTLECTNMNFEGSKCSFGCQDGYVLKLPQAYGNIRGDIKDQYDIICRSDPNLNYHWSGQEPYCEKVVTCEEFPVSSEVLSECKQPLASRLGIASSAESGVQIRDQPYTNGTTCAFSCASPKSLSDSNNIAICLDTGKWNISALSCIAGCPTFVAPTNGVTKCTLKQSYHSQCTFQCSPHFVMVGSGNMVCQTSGKWGNSPPRCVCPSCRSGVNCTNNTRFADAAAGLNVTTNKNTYVIYDGHNISCSPPTKKGTTMEVTSEPASGTAFSCQCRDKTYNKNKQCNGQTSELETCQRALASLILIMSNVGFYSLPCDADQMPTLC